MKMTAWPLCALTMIKLTVVVPLVVEVEVGAAPASVRPKVMFTVSLPVFVLLLYRSCACMVTLKAIPAFCGELIFDTV